MEQSFVAVNKTVQMERNSITPEWVRGQRQANIQAGVGLFVCIAPVGVGVVVLFGLGLDTAWVVVGVSFVVSLVRFGLLNLVVFTQSEHASDEARAQMEVERNYWKGEYERVNQDMVDVEARLLAVSQDNKRLREQNSSLTWQNNKLQEQVNTGRVSEAKEVRPLEKMDTAPAPVDPALADAGKIVELWFENQASVSRDNLLKLGMSRPGIEAAWRLLDLLGIAGKEKRSGKERNIIVKDADTVYDLFESYRNRVVDTVRSGVVRPIV